MLNFFGLFAGITGIAGYIPYIHDILRHKTKPDRTSWLIWTFEYAVLFLAQLARGARNTLWLVGLQLLGVVLVYGLSLFYGVGSLNRRKQLLLVCVGVALLLWYLTKSPDVAIVLLVAIEISGVILTTYKVYKHPGTETLTMWWLIGLAGLLAMVATGRGKAVILYLYPASLIVMSSGVVLASLLGSANKHREALPTESSAGENSDLTSIAQEVQELADL